MRSLLSIFLDNLVPVLLATGSGFALAKIAKIEASSFSKIIFYVFSPCLIFSLLVNSNVSNGEIVQVMSYATITILTSGVFAFLVSHFLGFDRKTKTAVLLTSMFMNSGNFGLSVVLFAFGQEALEYASLFFIANAILAYTAGVLIASMGTTNWLQALKNLLKVPIVYALVLALILIKTGWKIPLFVDRTVSILADASIPSMLVLLGIQLARAQWRSNSAPIAIASLIRLGVGPTLAILFAPVFGITGFVRQGNVLEAAMPSAVLSIVLSTEYNVKPALVTAIVMITTMISPLTLTPLIAFLGA